MKIPNPFNPSPRCGRKGVVELRRGIRPVECSRPAGHPGVCKWRDLVLHHDRHRSFPESR